MRSLHLSLVLQNFSPVLAIVFHAAPNSVCGLYVRFLLLRLRSQTFNFPITVG
jgi:hypothetical protein